MRPFVSVLAILVSIGSAVPIAEAQTSHAAPPSALDAALQQHVSAIQADRDTVLRLLERPEVRALAGDVGLDLKQAETAISTLEGQELGDLAAQARDVEDALAGGQSRIVISTTLLIIALLVLILLIVALK